MQARFGASLPLLVGALVAVLALRVAHAQVLPMPDAEPVASAIDMPSVFRDQLDERTLAAQRGRALGATPMVVSAPNVLLGGIGNRVTLWDEFPPPVPQIPIPSDIPRATQNNQVSFTRQ
ncbi:hypothetical protein [Burkholderia thailandensis]|uniref:hypothetical protein n=2 Tax=Burkholderia thailandensis TaxID=57975 RepID=UPI0003EC8CD2|nr:hypothetical protein [Burkholderia thailandensis]AHI73610.1 hypothetical protein BTQ_950 [Burkholderia thailandensis 2002721723]AIP24433.1 hypothetical protein DR63_2709 [Burkholderia thailandensis E264]AIS95904.1 hypothetical protein BTHA_2987 [Burkholderia thailandensis MSMB59]AIT19660.1 hypothetical protein BTN_1938 [Burkholderia thailandensis E254]AJX98060.1 hypothetical protein BG87_2966 [Burkholderia thailandensis 2002721643]